jgi:hypothetical protein
MRRPSAPLLAFCRHVKYPTHGALQALLSGAVKYKMLVVGHSVSFFSNNHSVCFVPQKKASRIQQHRWPTFEVAPQEPNSSGSQEYRYRTREHLPRQSLAEQSSISKRLLTGAEFAVGLCRLFSSYELRMTGGFDD